MKIEPGVCGCNKTEDADDNDGDGIPNCKDICPEDPDHVNTDGDAWPDCYEDCDFNPEKKHEGLCGCGCPETTGCTDPDFDGDLICDCWDLCPETEGIFQYPDYGCPEPI
jgi:hypothetical protein